ncbi:MAG: bifunctional oligoribonuclease/PAP phosphatase NrnA, partial [Patescibacteria group bacterium]
KASTSILILTHQDPDGDAIGSALALQLALEKMGKKPEVVFSGQVDETFQFLPGFSGAKRSLVLGNDLVVTVDTRQTGEELRLGYRKFPSEHRVKIVITAPKGTLSADDLRIERQGAKYDLLIILDTASSKLLGSIYEENPDLFYETPTVAIDHHQTNGQFAKINWVDITATSTAEMLVSLIESLGRDEPILDGAIATNLLTGLIGDTGSFQNLNTTPKSLTVAAQLVAAGADHQEILRRTKARTLPSLKLWGKALEHLTEEPLHRFIWTTISLSDAKSLGVDAGGYGLIDELLKNVGGVDFVAVLTEKEEGWVNVTLRSVEPVFDVSQLAKEMGGGGHKPAAGFRFDGTLAQQGEQIINQLRSYQTRAGH